MSFPLFDLFMTRLLPGNLLTMQQFRMGLSFEGFAKAPSTVSSFIRSRILVSVLECFLKVIVRKLR